MRNLRPVAQTSIWSQLLHFENIQYGCQHYCSRASSLWANSWVPQEIEWAIIEPRAHFFSQIFVANAVSDHDTM